MNYNYLYLINYHTHIIQGSRCCEYYSQSLQRCEAVHFGNQIKRSHRNIVLTFSGQNLKDGSRYFARNLGFYPPNYGVTPQENYLTVPNFANASIKPINSLFICQVYALINTTQLVLETGTQNPVPASARLEATHKQNQCISLFKQSTS